MLAESQIGLAGSTYCGLADIAQMAETLFNPSAEASLRVRASDVMFELRCTVEPCSVEPSPLLGAEGATAAGPVDMWLASARLAKRSHQSDGAGAARPPVEMGSADGSDCSDEEDELLHHGVIQALQAARALETKLAQETTTHLPPPPGPPSGPSPGPSPGPAVSSDPIKTHTGAAASAAEGIIEDARRSRPTAAETDAATARAGPAAADTRLTDRGGGRSEGTDSVNGGTSDHTSLSLPTGLVLVLVDGERGRAPAGCERAPIQCPVPKAQCPVC